MSRVITSDEVRKREGIALGAFWTGHNGSSPRPAPTDRVVRLLLGKADLPGGDVRLVLENGKAAAPDYTVWEGQLVELRSRFEALRLEALCAGLYPRRMLIETAPLLDAADAGSIYLSRRLAPVDLVQAPGCLPDFSLLLRRDLILRSRHPGSRSLSRLARGQRVTLALTPPTQGQLGVYGAPELQADSYSYLAGRLQSFAEVAAIDVAGVTLLDINISAAPSPPVALDILAYEGFDVRSLAWAERQSLLRQLLSEIPTPDFDLRLLDLDEPLDADTERMIIDDASAYGSDGWISVGRAV